VTGRAAYRDDDVRYVPIFRNHFQPVDRIAVPDDIGEEDGAVLLDPEGALHQLPITGMDFSQSLSNHQAAVVAGLR
jgi:hypothetical protein